MINGWQKGQAPEGRGTGAAVLKPRGFSQVVRGGEVDPGAAGGEGMLR